MSEPNFEDDWSDLRPSTTTLIQTPESGLKGAIDLASAKTERDLLTWAEKNPGALDVTVYIARGMKTFWGHLSDELRGINLTGLIEIILTQQGMSGAELKGFVRAIPVTLLLKITESPLGASTKAIHALIALEVLVRTDLENDYSLTTLPSGGLEVSLLPRKTPSDRLTFTLDESFSLATPSDGVESETREESSG
jgi:hypothetical protein